jgi:hypothetical protein
VSLADPPLPSQEIMAGPDAKRVFDAKALMPEDLVVWKLDRQ